jgi:DNA-binding NarL/FixJ family response regulator
MKSRQWSCRKSNQFGLTDRQVDAVSALVRLGEDKLVARELGVTVKCISTLLRQAQDTMAVRSRVHLALKWDRRMKEVGVQVPNSVFQLGQMQ